MTFRVRLATLAVLASLLGPTASAAQASSGDAAATGEYLSANFALVSTARSLLRQGEAAPLKVLAQVTRDCPMAAAGSPQDSQSTQMSDEVIGSMVLGAYHLNVPGLHRFVTRVRGLHWSNGRLTRAVRAYAAQLQTLAALAPPNLCADIASWKASGFSTLPPTTVRFASRFMEAWVALGLLPPGLSQYETAQQRALARRCDGLEVQLTDGEARAVDSWGKIMNELLINP